MAIGSTEFWRGKFVTRGQLAGVVVLQFCITGCVVGYVAVRGANKDEAIHQEIVREKEERRSEFKTIIDGQNTIRSDIEQLSRLLIVSEKADKKP